VCKSADATQSYLLPQNNSVGCLPAPYATALAMIHSPLKFHIYIYLSCPRAAINYRFILYPPYSIHSIRGNTTFGRLHPRYTQTQTYPNTFRHPFSTLSRSRCPPLTHEYMLFTRSSRHIATPIKLYHRIIGHISQVGFTVHTLTPCIAAVKQKMRMVTTPRYAKLSLII